MFIETHLDRGITLTFIKSTNVQAYPCGRRRSTAIDKDGNEATVDDQFYFPFDPEARLNTEANNRKHSSLNGYTQTYLKEWNETNKLLTMSLAGYLFNITLADSCINDATFAEKVLEKVAAGDATATNIYANILIEDVQLFSSGVGDSYTGVLRNQSAGQQETSLDLLKTGITDISRMKDFNNYYFSGLSFSVSPLTGIDGTRSEKAFSVTDGDKSVNQRAFSLHILEKVEGTWHINQAAYLPKIEHGETEDSIVVTGDALMKSNLSVEDNINVGSPTNPATRNNGGNIVAKYDITAEHDLIAKNDIAVDKNATVKTSLVVGSRSDEDSSEEGVITAKTQITTPILEATDNVTTQIANITSTLTVQNSGSAQAIIDKATIAEAKITNKTTIEGELVVTNNHPDKATLNNATITGSLIVSNPAKAADPDADPAELVADSAGIIAISAGTIEAERAAIEDLTIGNTFGAASIQQKIDNVYYDVPVIFLEQKSEGDKTTYQLQIARVNPKN